MFTGQSGPEGSVNLVQLARNANKDLEIFPGPVGSRSRRFCPVIRISLSGLASASASAPCLLGCHCRLLAASRSWIGSTRKPRHPSEIHELSRHRARLPRPGSQQANAAARAGPARALSGPLLRRRGAGAGGPALRAGLLDRRRGAVAGAGAVARRRRWWREDRKRRGEGGGGILLGRVGAGGDGRDRQHGEARRRARLLRRAKPAHHHRLDGQLVSEMHLPQAQAGEDSRRISRSQVLLCGCQQSSTGRREKREYKQNAHYSVMEGWRMEGGSDRRPQSLAGDG